MKRRVVIALGAELFIVALVIDNNREPDFAAGRRTIAALRSEDVEVPEEFGEDVNLDQGGIDVVRRQLYEDLERLAEAIQCSREMDWIELRGLRVYLTGGMSSGDAPTHLFEVVCRLRAVRGVLAAVGFEA